MSPALAGGFLTTAPPGKSLNWPIFNIVVSQGIGRPKEREKDGEHLVGRAVRTHIYLLSSLSYIDIVHGAPPNNYNSNIKDH